MAGQRPLREGLDELDPADVNRWRARLLIALRDGKPRTVLIPGHHDADAVRKLLELRALKIRRTVDGDGNPVTAATLTSGRTLGVFDDRAVLVDEKAPKAAPRLRLGRASARTPRSVRRRARVASRGSPRKPSGDDADPEPSSQRVAPEAVL